MSQIIDNPFPVTLQGGALDGHTVPFGDEPALHAVLTIRYVHDLLSTPSGTIKAARVWQCHQYTYRGQHTAAPLRT